MFYEWINNFCIFNKSKRAEAKCDEREYYKPNGAGSGDCWIDN
tara:strand:- start:371 stop:499 length:129 start_codon:yes stop_codon:yes gene_type:complete